ncbi:MAG: GspE/PulE family protein [Candidatus Daviesbacteria bacterium]|nr:GspE/PulE family protein [Candidatus Daviesbacteria bacterium]
MNTNDQIVKEILLHQSYVTPDDILKAEEYAKEHNSSIVDYLFTSGLINRSLLGQAVAEAFKVPFFNLTANPPQQEQILKIPKDIALQYYIVLAEEEPLKVTIATANPNQENLKELLQKLFSGKIVDLVYSFPKDIESLFVNYRQPLVARLSSALKDTPGFAPKILEELFEEAAINKVSDIHFEPQENAVIIRFRIDGVLQTHGNIPKPLYENILNRIKVKSRLRIDEHKVPQDGAMRMTVNGKLIDLRISVVPTMDGEKTAIRILSAYLRDYSLSDIGLSQANQQLTLAAIRKPFGMIICTGPTGSGKTTTLYALIKLLNRPEVNITTIEDPIEYRIIGVNQIQVNPATNLTFAKGLRSIIRQDPNIILVGEIRDPETAEIAVNAALTGHLLLTTFHANDAATAIPRLLDVGVEPFLMASTLELIVAQRLVRTICQSCKMSQFYPKNYIHNYFPNLKNHFLDDSTTLYRGKGCTVCHGTGYKGRSAIFEFIAVGKEMRELILQKPSVDQIWQLAKSEGSKDLFEDGMEKVKVGITTLEEVLRVASPR